MQQLFTKFKMKLTKSIVGIRPVFNNKKNGYRTKGPDMKHMIQFN